jgi:hypothetical protein
MTNAMQRPSGDQVGRSQSDLPGSVMKIDVKLEPSVMTLRNQAVRQPGIARERGSKGDGRVQAGRRRRRGAPSNVGSPSCDVTRFGPEPSWQPMTSKRQAMATKYGHTAGSNCPWRRMTISSSFSPAAR